VERFANAFRSFGVGRMMVMLGVAIGVAATLAFTVFDVGAKPKSLLYSNLDLKEASEIGAALDAAGVKYEAKGDGSVIYVERDKVASTKLMLASRGLPTSGSMGYELFDQSNALGQTDFTQQLNRQRATEGELARTIKAINGVTYSRVQIVMPKRELFAEEAAAPTASVVVGFGRSPDASQVSALQNLVAAAVPGLKPDRVVITDQKSGKTLAGGDGEGGPIGQVAAERRAQAEAAMEQKVKSLVEGIVGAGKARVIVSADVDLSRVTTQAERYDPDGQVVRQTTTNEEETKEGSSGVGGETTVANNIPGGDPAVDSTGSSAGSTKTEEATTYEISKTVETKIIEPGAIKKLSVSVAVDDVMTPGEGKKPATFAKRSAADIQNIEALVQAAIGFDAARGDQVKVTNVRFQRDPGAEGGVEAKGGLLEGLDKNDAMRGGELAVLLIVALLTIFFVARPMLKGAGGGGLMQMPMMAGAGGGQVLPGATGPMSAQLGYDPATGQQTQIAGPADDNRIDIARIEGQVKASAVKQVSDFVDRHPDESVSILRSWLHEA
jgi:flagellar M-ring protein FliF